MTTGEVAAATAVLRASEIRRDKAIRDAYHAGVPVPKIAAAAGITRGRVYQVLRKQ